MAYVIPNDTSSYYSGVVQSANPYNQTSGLTSAKYDEGINFHGGYSSQELNMAGLIDDIYGYSASNNALMQEAADMQRAWSAKEAEKARGFNAAEAAKNRDWQQMMSNTAHQREIVDLKAAGLNPVLSAMNGNGASVGSGATASSVMPSGAEANVDTSANQAIVSLLGHFLSAQTQLEAANINARTNEAVADKTTAMSQLVAELNAATQRYSVDVSSETSKRNTDVSASAGMYSADANKAAAAIQAAAAKYGYDVSAMINANTLAQERWRLENYPNNAWQVLDNMVHLLSGSDSASGGSSGVKGGIAGKSVDALSSALGSLWQASDYGNDPLIAQWFRSLTGSGRHTKDDKKSK